MSKYIPFTEVVKQKREALKKAFPDFKFSVTKYHTNSVHVSVLEAPVKLIDSSYEQLNHFYVRRHYAHDPAAAEILGKICDIANAGNYTVSDDADYGAIPDFYVHVQVGEWNRPFKLISGAGAFVMKAKKK